MIEKVSIIISAYEASQFIEQCLDSIFSQTADLNNYEILLGVDGCFSTLNKVRLIKSKYKGLRVFYFKENMGPYTVFNTLSELANHNVLLFFGADDMMKPTMVQAIMNFQLERDILQYRFVDIKIINNTIKYLGEGMLSDGAFSVSKIKFNEIGGFKPWICGGDTDFTLRAKRNHFNLGVINQILFFRRIHDNSLTMRLDTGLNSEMRKNYIKEINLAIKNNELKIEKIINNNYEIIS